jgi:hypothetical protein
MRFVQRLLKLVGFVLTRANVPILGPESKNISCGPRGLHRFAYSVAENEVLLSKLTGSAVKWFFS